MMASDWSTISTWDLLSIQFSLNGAGSNVATVSRRGGLMSSSER